MAKKTPYTDPELRQRILRDVKAGSKGGRAGQWSARKAQMVARRYESAMAKKGKSPYRGSKTPTQGDLKKWTSEEWTTSDGAPAIRKDQSGQSVTKRYLPKKAWEKLSPAERKATNRKKTEASKKGKQFAGNTRKAKSAASRARKPAKKR